MANITTGENMVRNRLLKIRLEMGYRFQKDFAEFLGFKPHQYNPWELNRVQPNIDTAFKICDKLNIKLEQLFTYSPD